MEPWILITFAAAAFQTVRFLLQKRLSAERLTAAGATFSRFIYSFPAAFLIAITYQSISQQAWPVLTVSFWSYALIGGISQILATVFTVMLLNRRNFAVGITFKKTEVILSVIVGIAVLGDTISFAALGAILLGLMGVLLLSRNAIGGGFDKGAVALGLASGLLFAFSGVGYRAATLAIASDDPFLRASVALSMVTLSQALVMALYLRWREVGEITRVLKTWRSASLIGLTSLGGSLSWFTAFTLQTVGLVKAVGQIELILSILVGRLIFGEHLSKREAIGIATIGASVVALVLISA
ncbi:EamA family transporter [Donghicola tyrosinivorans]|uniref:EamA-like transporter family protein n=1 Tax=Donghicola tyrosinivorans TaxID=1652492 RepID=A0A2T0WWP1_9RHOB|nr:EamA family transporter [Donghicola tyrosinivorans]PRY91116.1 EamA-like transporter family protein [Donghicola tyrosinivorans]